MALKSLSRRLARRENKALAEHYGAAWTEYKKHTKSLIPFIY
jgi:protein-S-isoprenylcysteine O-methyltransferase Ste14